MQFIDLKTQYQRIKQDIDTRIHAVLDHGQYILGPEVRELESTLASYVGCKYALGVASGTDALLIALMALDVKAGDEVITTAFSFFASAEVIALLGAKPVFVDVDPDTYNIDPSLIEAAITNKTKAIMPVSLYGQCADMDAINAIADKHNLPVIEDGAQSFGAIYKGKKSCALSTIGCTSFFPSKPLGAYGDGGACFTNSDALAEKMRQIRVHGDKSRYEHIRLGVCGRLDSMQAAVLLGKLQIFDEEVVARERLGAAYSALLNDVAKTPVITADNKSVYAQYTIEVPERETFIAAMKDKSVPTAVHYPSVLPAQPALLPEGESYQYGQFPNAEYAAAHVVSLPMHPYLLPEQQKAIVVATREVLAELQAGKQTKQATVAEELV